ncbi:MAG: ChaN family lipoprotein [Desulfobacteraceae bacterium]|jgi:uncharacterized iron-regulated protein|nr:ChaN family lipoprotein [Desulfobacteraceae bacterium]
MKPKPFFIAVFLFLAGAPVHAGEQVVLDVATGQRLGLTEILPRLLAAKIVVVGEKHATEAHHRAQASVIRALDQAGAQVAVGLEMFRRDSQADLDRWVTGGMAPEDFEAVFVDNWGFPWAPYRTIFEYVQEHRVPLVGLNIAREITRQVARDGFQSLSEAQRGQIGDVTCSVDDAYMKFIRDAYGAHAHGSMNFTHFCEAQMLWDAAMAAQALKYLEAHPEAVVVILAGVGHARRGAIPRQIVQRSTAATVVILPEVPGEITADTVGTADADCLLLDLAPE